MEITWTICKTKQKNNSGKLYYSRKEEAFIMEEETLSDFSFMVGKQYVSLDASIESSSIVGVSGFCSPDHWIYQAFDTPTCEEGLLSFSSDEPLLSGTGFQLNSSWETFFNPNTKWFKLSDTVFCCESFYKRKEISYSYHLDSFCPIHCCGLEKPLLCEKAQYQNNSGKIQWSSSVW